jgi:hypothetical protein
LLPRNDFGPKCLKMNPIAELAGRMGRFGSQRAGIGPFRAAEKGQSRTRAWNPTLQKTKGGPTLGQRSFAVWGFVVPAPSQRTRRNGALSVSMMSAKSKGWAARLLENWGTSRLSPGFQKRILCIRCRRRGKTLAIKGLHRSPSSLVIQTAVATTSSSLLFSSASRSSSG